MPATLTQLHKHLTAGDLKPVYLLLLYAPIDSVANRALTGLAFEWENFGHRELLTPDELRAMCAHPDFEILAADAVGFHAAVWARKKR